MILNIPLFIKIIRIEIIPYMQNKVFDDITLKILSTFSRDASILNKTTLSTNATFSYKLLYLFLFEDMSHLNTTS